MSEDQKEEKECPHGLTKTCSSCHGYSDGHEDQKADSASVPMTMVDTTEEDAINESTKSMLEDAEKQYNDLVGKIVKPHTKKSRPVTDDDTNKIQDDLQVLYQLCRTPVGMYQGAYAMAHAQINDTDPLQLFVMNNMLIVCNPVITRHSGYTKDSKEACVTFSDREMTTVQRWQKIDCEYQTIQVDPTDSTKFKLSETIKESLSGRSAWIFQHEADHGSGCYIYKLEQE